MSGATWAPKKGAVVLEGVFLRAWQRWSDPTEIKDLLWLSSLGTLIVLVMVINCT